MTNALAAPHPLPDITRPTYSTSSTHTLAAMASTGMHHTVEEPTTQLSAAISTMSITTPAPITKIPTEVLENILLHLPLRQLLLAQRVCRSFRSTITNSPRIMSALFLRSSNDGAVRWQDAGTSIEAIAFCRYDVCSQGCWLSPLAKGEALEVRPIVNPFIRWQGYLDLCDISKRRR